MSDKVRTFCDAIVAIGGDYSITDWKLEPKRHSKIINEEGHELKKLLLSEQVSTIVDIYNDASSRAKSAQKEYKAVSRLMIYASAGATIIGSIILFLGKDGVRLESLTHSRELLLAAQIFFVALQVSLKYKLQKGSSFSKWQTERSNAESTRIDLFETVCLAKNNFEKPIWLLQLQLEYFIRYQLSIQLKFYKERGIQHEEELKKYVNRGTILTFVITLSAATAASISKGINDMVGIIAIAGLIAPVLLSVQGSISLLNQDQRNFERYKITHANLQKMRGRLDDIRSAAASGDRNRVEEFIRSVNALISVEHKQWKYDFNERDITRSETS